MGQLWRSGGFALATTLAMAVTPVMAQEAKSPNVAKTPKAVDTVSGVIVKADTSKTSPRKTLRLTINSAAVWRDWVRDQASAEPKSTRKAASDGQKSIATSGEPQSADTLVVVELAPDAKIETRYRSSTDELSEGSKSPEKAAAVEAANDPADTSKPKSETRANSKTPTFKLEDLKPGLYVEVTLRRDSKAELATLVRVMRPVGGANTPASVEKPTDK